MEFYSKIKWILGILLVFVLIFATNLIDRSNFVRVKDSVITIYEDRIVANELIFEISCLFHEKEIAVLTKDTLFYTRLNAKANASVNEFIVKFGKTKLTEEESEVFNELKTNFDLLKKAEKEFVETNFTQNKFVYRQMSDIKANLYTLSKIQTDEGERQWSISKSAIDTIELFTQMEIYLMAFLAIVIQILILYKPSEKDGES